MTGRRLAVAALVLIAGSAAAQRPLFEPDDFIDPAILSGPAFLTRVIAGGVWNPSDRFRPIAGDAGLVMLTNSLHYERIQFDYKHAELFGLDDSPPLRRCDCPEPVYFPTPPPAGATPDGPAADRSDTLQLAFYRTGSENTFRYRLAFTRRESDTTVLSANGQPLERRSLRDHSFTLDADTHVRLLGHDVWGTLYFARASSSGSPAGDRTQNELAYTWRPPGFAAGPLLMRGKLTVGGITGRGASGINLINPYFEAIWSHERARLNVHAAWSGEFTRSGLEGWRRNHQIAVFADHTLFVKIFGKARE